MTGRFWHFLLASIVRKMISKNNMTLLLTTGLLISACKSTTVIDEYRDVESNIVSGESIVVLGRRHNSNYETESNFVSCVGKSISVGKEGINVIPEKLFIDSMYPYFENSTAPMDVKNLGRLVKNSAIAQKFSDMQIRYFIWIDGNTERTDSSGSISCSLSPAGGGCFGFATWDDEASYEASVWDLKTLDLTGRISAETVGTSYMPAIIVPIPLLARVQINACSSMANQIKQFLQ